MKILNPCLRVCQTVLASWSFCCCLCLLSLVGFYVTFLSNLLCSYWDIIIIEFESVAQLQMWIQTPKTPEYFTGLWIYMAMEIGCGFQKPGEMTGELSNATLRSPIVLSLKTGVPGIFGMLGVSVEINCEAVGLGCLHGGSCEGWGCWDFSRLGT